MQWSYGWLICMLAYPTKKLVEVVNSINNEFIDLLCTSSETNSKFYYSNSCDQL